MSKETDYKKLWRKATEQNVTLFNELNRLKEVIGKLQVFIEKVEAGEIKIKPKATKNENKK